MEKAYFKFILFLGISFVLTAIGSLLINHLNKDLITQNILGFFAIYVVILITFIVSKGLIKKLCFFIFCLFTGVNISSTITYCHIENTNISLSILLTAIIFMICYAIGFFIKKDISNWGVYLFLSLIIVLILICFLYSLFIDILIVILYSLFIIYDVYIFKSYLNSKINFNDDDILDFVMNVYLDLINIFISIIDIINN